jgi:hypothetical protein
MGLFATVLESPVVSRIRRNHGLEHATIHILSDRRPGRSLTGHSDAGGFWLLGDVSTEEVNQAAGEALERMRGGEHHLAIHPNCGTNFVTYGIAAGIAGALAMVGVGRRGRDKLERLPLAAMFATIALILAQPLGFRVQQRVTTSGHPDGLEIVDVTPSRRGNLTAHRVITQG